MKMLAHLLSMKLNEAMNDLVLSYAFKTKNFFGTITLKSRVAITGIVETWIPWFLEKEYSRK